MCTHTDIPHKHLCKQCNHTHYTRIKECDILPFVGFVFHLNLLYFFYVSMQMCVTEYAHVCACYMVCVCVCVPTLCTADALSNRKTK